MTTLQKVLEDVQKSNPVQLEEIQTLLAKQKRERLKAAAQALATSTKEEQQVFLANVQSKMRFGGDNS
jgi:RecA-family ATPase